MSGDMQYGIKLTAEGGQAIAEVKAFDQATTQATRSLTEQARAIADLGRANGLQGLERALKGAGAASQEYARGAAAYLEALQKEVLLLGKSGAERRVLEVGMQGLSGAQQEAALSAVATINAHEAQASAMQRTAAMAGELGRGLAGVGAAFVAFVQQAVGAASAADQIEAKLGATLTATGLAAGVTRAQIDELAEGMKRTTVFDDDQIRNAAAMMATFRNVQGATFTEGIRLAGDLSALLGRDLQGSVMQVGRVLNEPGQALGALTRAGVQFSAAQKEMIRGFEESGQLARAQSIILEEVQRQVGNVATEMNSGYRKAIGDVSKEWGDMLKEFGRSDSVKGYVTDFLGGLKALLADLRAEASGTATALRDIRIPMPLGLGSGSYNQLRGGGGVVGQPGKTGWDLVDPRYRPAAADPQAEEARAGAEKQRLEKLADDRAAFLARYRTKAQKHAEELAAARQLFEGDPSGLAKAQAGIAAKYGGGGREGDDTNDAARVMAKAYASLYQEAAKYRTELDAQAEADGKLTRADNLMAEAKARLSGAMRDEVMAQLEAARGRESEIAGREAIAKATAGWTAEAERRGTTLVQETARLQDQSAQLGLSAAALGEYRAGKLDVAAAAEQLAAAELSEAAAHLEAAGTLPEVARAYRDLAKARAEAAGQISGQATLQREIGSRTEANKIAEDMARSSERISADLTSALMRGFEKGGDSGRAVMDALRNYARTLILEPLIKPIVAPFADVAAAIGKGFAGQVAGWFGGGGEAAYASAWSGFEGAYPVMHAGGIAGEGGTLRAADARLFAGAPRYHGGGVAGLAPDEVPAILQRGERVLPRRDNAGGAGGAVRVELVNRGAEKAVAQAQASFDASGLVVRLFLEDLRTGGPIRRGMESSFGLRGA